MENAKNEWTSGEVMDYLIQKGSDNDLDKRRSTNEWPGMQMKDFYNNKEKRRPYLTIKGPGEFSIPNEKLELSFDEKINLRSIAKDYIIYSTVKIGNAFFINGLDNLGYIVMYLNDHLFIERKEYKSVSVFSFRIGDEFSVTRGAAIKGEIRLVGKNSLNPKVYVSMTYSHSLEEKEIPVDDNMLYNIKTFFTESFYKNGQIFDVNPRVLLDEIFDLIIPCFNEIEIEETKEIGHIY